MTTAHYQVFRRGNQYLCVCIKPEGDYGEGRVSRGRYSDNSCSACEDRLKHQLEADRKDVPPLPTDFTLDQVHSLSKEQRAVRLTEEHYRDAAKRGWVVRESHGHHLQPLRLSSFWDSDGAWSTDTFARPSFYSIDWRRAWCKATYGTEQYEKLGVFAQLPGRKGDQTYVAGGPRNGQLFHHIQGHGLPPHTPTGHVWCDDDGRRVGEFGYWTDYTGVVLNAWFADHLIRNGPPGQAHTDWLRDQPRHIRKKYSTEEELEAFDAMLEKERVDEEERERERALSDSWLDPEMFPDLYDD